MACDYICRAHLIAINYDMLNCCNVDHSRSRAGLHIRDVGASCKVVMLQNVPINRSLWI